MPIPEPGQFWPSTITGWITVIGFLTSTAWFLYQMGRWAQKLEAHKDENKRELNGIGERVKRTELGLEHEEGRMDALEVQLGQAQGHYESLIKILSEAKVTVDGLRTETKSNAAAFRDGIDILRKEQNDTRLHLSERLKAVETILAHK